MNLVTRIVKSVQDRSLPIKILNRISRTKYVPSQEMHTDEFLAEHYLGKGWKALSPTSRRLWLDLHPIFSKIEISDITYVGAHDGKMASEIDDAFPHRRFFLIEPAPSTFKKLIETVSSRPNIKCVNIAAGSQDSTLDLFVDDFSAASSLLPYTNAAIHEFPFLGQGKKTEVRVKKLDDILQQHGVNETDLLIIDVQGYEDEVLAGAQNTLKISKAVMIELSLQDLYLASSTFDSVYQALVGKGFHLRHLLNPARGSGQSILQIDGVFIRVEWTAS
jgi:FkbM family methyltransferase